jgi:small GTP-binding protein
MPTNLPAEYYEVEERYKAAASPDERVRLLEELISTVPKHKGTDKLRADLRRRLSKLKSASQKQKKVSRHVSAYQIAKEGAGQVVLIGQPNVGKSALLNALTNASPEVAAYPFTTWTPTPGMMDVGGAQIQLIDTPPLNLEYVEPAFMDLIRRSDLVVVVIDLQADPISQIEDSLQLLAEQRIAPERRRQYHQDRKRFIYLPFMIVVNKCDDQALEEDFEVLCELLEEDWPLVPLSAATGHNLDHFKQAVYQTLGIIRVFTKPPGKEPDLSRPYVLQRGTSVEAFAAKVHRDFFDQLKAARVWGSSAFDGQVVGRDHILQDGDVVELQI